MRSSEIGSNIHQQCRCIDLLVPSCYTQCVKVREAIAMVQSDGWFLARTRGSHRHFKHPTKRGIVTIAGKQGVDIPKGTLNSILKQAGLKA